MILTAVAPGQSPNRGYKGSPATPRPPGLRAKIVSVLANSPRRQGRKAILVQVTVGVRSRGGVLVKRGRARPRESRASLPCEQAPLELTTLPGRRFQGNWLTSTAHLAPRGARTTSL